jgi:hypothetical protein
MSVERIVLSAVFAAFVIWLAVRIFNRRAPWAICAAIIVGMLLYVVMLLRFFDNPTLRIF